MYAVYIQLSLSIINELSIIQRRRKQVRINKTKLVEFDKSLMNILKYIREHKINRTYNSIDFCAGATH